MKHLWTPLQMFDSIEVDCCQWICRNVQIKHVFAMDTCCFHVVSTQLFGGFKSCLHERGKQMMDHRRGGPKNLVVNMLFGKGPEPKMRFRRAIVHCATPKRTGLFRVQWVGFGKPIESLAFSKCCTHTATCWRVITAKVSLGSPAEGAPSVNRTGASHGLCHESLKTEKANYICRRKNLTHV